MSTPIQFVKAGDRYVAASEILSITPAPSGGFVVAFRGGLAPAHAADLSGLGEIRTARRGERAFCEGELRSIYAWRVCPVSNVATPIWGLRDVPLSAIRLGPQ